LSRAPHALNRLPHFRAAIDGYGLHFLHYRGRGPNRVPLPLMNGWPSSFVEFQRLAGCCRKASLRSSGGSQALRLRLLRSPCAIRTVSSQPMSRPSRLFFGSGSRLPSLRVPAGAWRGQITAEGRRGRRSFAWTHYHDVGPDDINIIRRTNTLGSALRINGDQLPSCRGPYRHHGRDLS
jgi:hypothetical protein